MIVDQVWQRKTLMAMQDTLLHTKLCNKTNLKSKIFSWMVLMGMDMADHEGVGEMTVTGYFVSDDLASQV